MIQLTVRTRTNGVCQITIPGDRDEVTLESILALAMDAGIEPIAVKVIDVLLGRGLAILLEGLDGGYIHVMEPAPVELGDRKCLLGRCMQTHPNLRAT